MYPTTFLVEVPTLDAPLTIDVAALYQQFQTIPDARNSRGKRYCLAVLLTIAVLSKLAGYSSARAIADWACARAEALAELFELSRARMPHATTWTRVFGHAAALEALEQVVAALSAPASTAEVP